MDKVSDLIERVLSRLPRPLMLAVLLALTLAAVMPAFTTLPPVDRDEPRFAQSAKQMIATRDPVDIRFQDEARYKKPVGIYWLQAATVAAVGVPGDTTIWKYRLPSLAAVLLSVLLTARIAAIFGGAVAGLMAGLLMAGVFLLGAEAHLATTDASLLAAILAAQVPLARLYRDARDAGFQREAVRPPGIPALILFWVALAVSVLLKGPIGPLVIGTTVALLALIHRRAGWLLALRPVRGLVGFLILVAPWFIAITLKSGGAFWSASLGHDLMSKVAGAQENHGAPPGTYLVLMWVTFFPASLALALSLPTLWRERRMPGVVFAFAWLLPSWLVFEAAPTKLIHYVLPLYPALAVAVALVWDEVLAKPVRRWQWIVAGAVTALPVLVLGAMGIYAVTLGSWPVLPLLGGFAALAVGAGLLLVALRNGHGSTSLLALWIMGAGFGGAAFVTAARVPALWPAPAIVAMAAPTAQCPVRPIVTDGYDEPSLVFLSPGPEHATNVQGVATAFAQDPCTIAVVADAAGFRDAVRALSVTPVEKGSFAGLNLGSGHKLALTVYARP